MNWYEDPNILIPCASVFGTIVFIASMAALGTFSPDMLRKNDKQP